MDAINEYSEYLKKDKGITCGMYGLDYSGADKINDGKIHTISLGYDTDKRMKYEEARTFCYEIVDGLLTKLNKNEKIRPYFFHYPLTYADLEIHLTFDFDNRYSLKRNEVASIHIEENEILYLIVDKESPHKKANPKTTPTESLGDYIDLHRVIRHKLPEKIN
jgi:hypothetical protein